MIAYQKSANSCVEPNVTAKDAPQIPEQSYKRLIENSLQGFAVLMPSQGFVFVNDAFCDLFGFGREELVGARARILHPDNADEVIARQRARARGNDRPNRYEIRARKKDGTELWVEYLSSITEWNGERATLLAALDITDRKRDELRIVEQERNFRQLFFNAPVAIYRSVGARIVDVNPALENLLGYSAAELVGKKRRDLMPAQDTGEALRLSDVRKSGAENLQVEHRMRRKDGTTLWVVSYFTYADDRPRDQRTVIVHILDISHRR